ncbi:unnamed protein product [Pipistrellus nathusii]|uniref:Homeobox domain-containing protein n=1 Tax=Pipistrellus nathusii TaxID=59473 RepID=A0ABN9ZVS4_PIPNA
METFFKGKPYGNFDEREALAAMLDLQEYQVQVWFKNRRAKERRLQRPWRGQKSPGAHHALPQKPGAWAPQPAPAPSDPAFRKGLVLPASPVLPQHSPWQVFPAADASASSYSQACWHPAQGVRDMVPAAPAPAAAPAPDPDPAEATVWPQVPDDEDNDEDDAKAARNASPDPDFTELLSALEGLEEPFSSPRP